MEIAGVETLLDAGQVAEMLRLSVATIRKRVLKGYIPYRKMGRAVRFSASEIENWARGRNTGSVQPLGQGHEGNGK